MWSKMQCINRICGLGAAVLVGMAFTPATNAETFSFSGTASGGQSADANFIFSSSGGVTTLSIQLISTTAQPYTGGAGNQHLTGLFFDLAGINSSSFSYNGLVSDPAFNDLINNDFTSRTGDSTTADQYWAFNDMTSDTSASTNLSSVGGQEFALFAAGFFDLPDIGNVFIFKPGTLIPLPPAFAMVGSVFKPGTLIPLPPAVAMGLIGLVGVAVGRKRYLKKSVTEFSRLHIE